MGGGGEGGRTGIFSVGKICFPSLIYCDQRCMVAIFWLTCDLFHSWIGLFAKLYFLWITSLLFDLNNKFINESFTFSPG